MDMNEASRNLEQQMKAAGFIKDKRDHSGAITKKTQIGAYNEALPAEERVALLIAQQKRDKQKDHWGWKNPNQLV